MAHFMRKFMAGSILAAGLLTLGTVATVGAVSITTAAPAAALEADVASRWDAVLQGYVKPVDSQGVARFDYAGLTANQACLLYTSPSPRDRQKSRMPSSA